MIPAWLEQELREGPLSFERFMHLALYHPTHGYYTTRIKKVGREGDFSTTATLSTALAQALAHWIQEECAQNRIRAPYHVIEVGPGDGSLAFAILSSLPWSFRRRIRLHLIELSPPLQTLQRNTLKKYTRQITWHSDLSSALLSLPPKEAFPLIYSNELLDAFPVRIFRGTKGAFDELHLSSTQGHLQEEWLHPKELPDSSVFAPSWPQNQRLEVATSAQSWLTESLIHLHQGRLLTIDYGGFPKEIYHRRPHGTVRAYFQHQCLTGPALYHNIGHQDLTADVNFEDLMMWGHSLSLEHTALLSQREFLTPFLSSRKVDQFLAAPEGAGSAFKVLIQRRG